MKLIKFLIYLVIFFIEKSVIVVYWIAINEQEKV